MNKDRLARKIQDLIAWSQLEKERYVELIDQETDKRLSELRKLCQHDWPKWHERHDENVLGGINTAWVRSCNVCRLVEWAEDKPEGEIVTSHHVRTLP